MIIVGSGTRSIRFARSTLTWSCFTELAKRARRIAACWVDKRKVSQVAFKPDWTRHKNAAPFKRNDAMLEALPIGIILFPGSGIVENLADKARKMGVPVWRFGSDGA